MNNSSQYQVLKSIETKKRKAYQLASKGDDNERIYNLDANMPIAGYMNAFNLYLNRLRDLEYRTKNPELFTWRQSAKYMNKLRNTEVFQKIDEMPKDEPADKKLIKTASENSLGVHRIASDNAFTPSKSFTQSGNKTVKVIKKPLSTARKSTTRNGSPFKKRENKYDNEPIIPNIIDVSKIDLSSIHRPKRAFSISKIQRSLLLPRSSSVPEVHNFQHMPNQFDRKNSQINRILCQIDPNEMLLDKEKIQQNTFREIQKRTKGHELHQFLRLRDKSASPLKRSNANLKERPSSASRQPHSALLPRDVLPKILTAVKDQEPTLTIQKQLSRERQDTDREHQNVSHIEKEKGTQINLRNLLDGERSAKRRKGIMSSNDKPKPKSLVKKMDNALRKLDELLNISTQVEEQSPSHHQSKSNFLHPKYNASTDRSHKRTYEVKKQKDNSPLDPENLLKNSSNSTPKHSGNRSFANSTDASPIYAPQTSEKDNFLNYKVYFKQKYQEKGISFGFSAQLNKKLHDVAKEVGQAIKNSQEL